MSGVRRLMCTVLAAAVLGACTREAPHAAAGASASQATSVANAITPAASGAPATAPVSLRMLVDTKAWIATQDVFAAVHPRGYDRAIVIAGSVGKQAPFEQAFTLNLYGIDKPGRYRITSARIAEGVIQFGSFDAARPLIGGILGYDATVDVVAFSADPLRVEVRFDGWMTGSDGVKVAIREGYFAYSE